MNQNRVWFLLLRGNCLKLCRTAGGKPAWEVVWELQFLSHPLSGLWHSGTELCHVLSMYQCNPLSDKSCPIPWLMTFIATVCCLAEIALALASCLVEQLLFLTGEMWEIKEQIRGSFSYVPFCNTCPQLFPSTATRTTPVYLFYSIIGSRIEGGVGNFHWDCTDV